MLRIARLCAGFEHCAASVAGSTLQAQTQSADFTRTIAMVGDLVAIRIAPALIWLPLKH